MPKLSNLSGVTAKLPVILLVILILVAVGAIVTQYQERPISKPVPTITLQDATRLVNNHDQVNKVNLDKANAATAAVEAKRVQACGALKIYLKTTPPYCI